MLWEVEIRPRSSEQNRAGARVAHEAADLGLVHDLDAAASQGYLIQGDLSAEQIDELARRLLVDPVVEEYRVARPADPVWNQPPAPRFAHVVRVLPKPGVMDPVAQSTLAAIGDCGYRAEAVRTLRKYWFTSLPGETLNRLCGKLLANDAIEQAVVGPWQLEHIELGAPYRFQLVTVPIRDLDDAGLMHLSKSGQLYLQLAEMQTIRDFFRELGRDPTDAELETLAQTWSEHCSHKTLTGRVRYTGPDGEKQYENLLKETIFAATQQLRKQWGERDWCVSVFKDNAGVITFDDANHVVFKVETHNHPSALEPYGGANTGLGGVIRDPLGTGMGAKPICNTDVFCFAPPTHDPAALPAGVLHPRRVMKGVVSGVRDYGNRMGIPTVNGAICFDQRYLGNPLVYCGNVGIIPHDKAFKEPLPGDHIVALGGRTGRDGIHGATFSSAELTSESESLSGGAVQIGNAITEKMVLDVLLQARDRNLFNAVTDCGAGGFSSAVGEMGADIGAQVWLERCPLKYDGLSYTEIWISEAQERMILAVPPDKWEAFHALAAAEGVEATVIGNFVPTGRLELFFHGERVADLSMHLLHDGRPPVIRPATYTPVAATANRLPAQLPDVAAALHAVLGDWNVASKEWVIRQYDHEVQAGSVLKPLQGARDDGPGNAAVIKPVLGSQRALVIGCGICPTFGDYDTYHMAAGAIDEALRNCVAVGADPAKIAILDNFCWGDCEKPETLGALVRAAQACYDLAVAFETPFISGKDSLNNEFKFVNADGAKQSIAIPHTLLISALGQMADARQAVSMDLKAAGNLLYVVGTTHDELAGSRFAARCGLSGGTVPQVNVAAAKQTFTALHRAILAGTVRACHDPSEGGLAVAIAEAAFAGEIGVELQFDALPGTLGPLDSPVKTLTALFSESNTRFICEVAPADQARFESTLAGIPHQLIGRTITAREFRLSIPGQAPVAIPLNELKATWQAPLAW